MNLKTTSRLWISVALACAHGKTLAGIHGFQFNINNNPSFTAASRFPAPGPCLQGTPPNVPAVQAIFDDANYSKSGSRAHQRTSNKMGKVFGDYPDGRWAPERKPREILAALLEWRRAGTLVFTVTPNSLGDQKWSAVRNVPTGLHSLRIVTDDMSGPRFNETCSILEIPYSIER